MEKMSEVTICVFGVVLQSTHGATRNVKRGTEFLTKKALKLAREFYESNNLRRKEVRTTRLVDFEGIARKFNINIRIYEPTTNSETARADIAFRGNGSRKKLFTTFER